MKRALLALAGLACATAVVLGQTLGTSQAQTMLSAILNATTNQLTLGASTHTLVISSTAPAGASQTLTLPDPTGADSVAYLALAQTLTNKTINAPIGILGGSATTANFVQTLSDPSTGNVSTATQTTFFPINTVTIPASAFNANGRALHCAAWGVTAANGNTKGFQFLFGASAALVAPATSAGSAVPFIAYLDVVRTGPSTQSGSASFMLATAVAPSIVQSTGLAQTDTGSIAVSMEANNQSAAASAATGNGMICTFLN